MVPECCSELMLQGHLSRRRVLGRLLMLMLLLWSTRVLEQERAEKLNATPDERIVVPAAFVQDLDQRDRVLPQCLALSCIALVSCQNEEDRPCQDGVVRDMPVRPNAQLVSLTSSCESQPRL